MGGLMQRQNITVPRPVLESKEDYVLSGDFVLPEYCPDIAVVLKCQVIPRIQNRQWSADQLLLDGTALLRVLYLDEERQGVRVAEFSQPISCGLRVESGAEAGMALLTLEPEYVNCRATSPRRLEVRGAFAIVGYAELAGSAELACMSEQENLYAQTMQQTFSTPCVSAEKVLSINEALDFDSGLPEAEQLLSGDCVAYVQECKLLAGKAIVKGQLIIHRLYTDDSSKGTTQTLNYAIPFSQILDLDGVKEGMLCTADVTLLSDSQRCGPNVDGRNSVLEIAAKLLVQVQVYEPVSVPLVLDAYHTKYPVLLENQELNVRSLVGCQRQTAAIQKNVELPAGDLQEVLDVWAQPMTHTGACRDGKAAIAGRMLLSMLVRDSDGMVAYYERPEEFQLEYPAQGDQVQAQFVVTGVEYTVVSGKLDLRVNLMVTLRLWNCLQQSVVQNVSLQEEQPYPPEKAAIKLYYGEPGERVWDIARYCHTSPQGIREENDLHGDVLDAKTVLVVPVV